jgi:hypothetical protein
VSSDQPPPFNLALGAERVGLISLRYPWLSLIILAALTIAAVLGIERIKVDDSLSQLFRSDTAEFRQFEEVTRRFPSSEFDVLLVVEGRNLMQRGSIEKLRDLVTDVQLIDGVRGLISLFSARQPPEGNQIPKALFPEELPEGAEYAALKQRVLSNEIIRGKLLSEDGTLALVVLSLDPAIVQTKGLNDTIGEIRKTMAEDLAGAGLTSQLSGVPVMQLEIRTAVERDRLVYNTIGFVAGCLIAILFFRRVSFMIIAAAPPLIAILLSLGALGWLDFRLNMFLNVMTPLIMVISFSDSMQLTFAARDRLIAGEDKHQAFRHAVLTVGPACELTHCTGRRPGFLHVVAGDRDRVELRHALGREPEDVRDDPHRGFWRIDVGVADHELLEDVVLDGSGEVLLRDALFLGRDNVERQDRQHRAVHRHRHRHFAERDLVEEVAHVEDRIDRNARHADIAGNARMVAVVAAMRGEVEGDRQALLPGREIAPVEGVGFFRGRESRILADGPGLAHIHGWIRTAHEGRQSGPCVKMGHSGDVGLAVEALQRQAFGRLADLSVALRRRAART